MIDRNTRNGVVPAARTRDLDEHGYKRSIAMRQRTMRFSLLCLAMWLCSGRACAWADVIGTVTQESGFGFVQTDYGPGMNVGANDPITFNKFNPRSGGIPANADLASVQISC